METVTYQYRGQIEVGTGFGTYSWKDGYSETMPNGSILYPWMTKQDCLKDAKARGMRSKFIR